MLFAANRVSSVYFCRQFLGVRASSTGGAVSGSTGRVMNASGASAQVLCNMAASDLLLRSKLTMICCLPRTVSLLSIFAVDFWVSGHRQTGGVVSGSTGRVMNASGVSA